jgi:MFS family permease
MEITVPHERVPEDRARLGELFGRRYALLTIGTIVLLGCNAFEIVGAATAMPAVLDDVGGVGLFGAAIAAPLVASVFAAPFGGRLADRFGTLRPLVLALVVFSVGLLATSFATSMAQVAAGRFVVGLGAGATLTLQLVIVARYYPLRLQPLVLGVVSAVFIIPGMIGPTISATLVETVGWPWIFGGIIPILVLCAALLVPEILRRPAIDLSEVDGVEGEPVDTSNAWGPALLAIGLGVIVLAGSASDARWLLLIPVGVLILLPGARVTLPRGTWTARPGMPAVVACALTACAAYLTTENFLPLLLRQVRGSSILEAGLPLTVAAFFWAAGSWVQARLRPGRRPAAASAGALVAAAGLVLAASLVFDVLPFWLAYPATALGSFGCGLVFTICQVIAVEGAPAGREGEATALVQLANLLGTAIGTTAAAIVIARLDDHLGAAVGTTMLVAAGFAGLASVAARRLPSTRPGP